MLEQNTLVDDTLVDDLTLSLSLYRIELEGLSEDSLFRTLIYSDGKNSISFPIAAFNLEMNDAFKIAEHYKGHMFKDEHNVVFIDTDSVLGFKAVFCPDAETEALRVAMDTLKQSCKEVVMLKKMEGRENGKN